MKKTLVLATSIAVLAGIWTVLVVNIGKFGTIPFVLWPTFVAWAAFFYLGANGDAIKKGLVQLFTGAILSGFFLWIYGMIGFNDPKAIWLGIFVVIIAWPLTALSGVNKLWSAVPAGFCRRGVLVRRQLGRGRPGTLADHHRHLDPVVLRYDVGLALPVDHQPPRAG